MPLASSSMIIRHFYAANPVYNIWLLPFSIVWLAASPPLARRLLVASQRIGLVLLVAASVYGTSILAMEGARFAHTPYRAVETLINTHTTDGMSIVYGCESQHPGKLSFAISYAHGDRVNQYKCLKRDQAIYLCRWSECTGSLQPSEVGTPWILVLSTRNLSSKELIGRTFDREIQPVLPPPTPSVRSELMMAGYTVTKAGVFSTFIEAEYWLMRRSVP